MKSKLHISLYYNDRSIRWGALLENCSLRYFKIRFYRSVSWGFEHLLLGCSYNWMQNQYCVNFLNLWKILKNDGHAFEHKRMKPFICSLFNIFSISRENVPRLVQFCLNPLLGYKQNYLSLSLSIELYSFSVFFQNKMTKIQQIILFLWCQNPCHILNTTLHQYI